MRILLYTGKGGVGVTTVAAATALTCAERGARTLLLSADAGPALATILGRPVGGAPLPVADGLWAQRADVAYEERTSWQGLGAWLQEVLAWRAVAAAPVAELSLLPGVDSVLTLDLLARHAEEARYDVLVVDGAPSDIMLTLLNLVELAGTMPDIAPERARSTLDLVGRLARPYLARLTAAPLPDDALLDRLRAALARLLNLRATLLDGGPLTVRLVLTAEQAVRADTHRRFTALHLHGFPVDLVVRNRAGYAASPGAAVEDAAGHASDAVFAPVPVLAAPRAPAEPLGTDALAVLGRALFGARDPTDRYAHWPSIRVEGQAGGADLLLSLPGARREEIGVVQHDDLLTLRVAGALRALPLPGVLAGMTCVAAHFDGGTLRLRFARAA